MRGAQVYFSRHKSPPVYAIAIVLLMISMPWSTTVDFRDEPVKFQSNNSSWGASGSVDTGWLTVGSESTGSSTTIVPHPPGASIENMTFEIGVNGSLGICAQDPILTLVDANQEIFDGTGIGGFGCKQSYSPNDVLDGYLDPYSNSQVGLLLPTGAALTDMVIEAMRPASPRLSPSLPNLVVHDLSHDASSGRTFILADDDLLVIDETVSNPIVHVESISATEIEVIQSEDLLVALSTDGNVHYYRLSNLEYLSSHFLNDTTGRPANFEWQENKPASLFLDSENRTWISNGCHILWRDSNASLESYHFDDVCTGSNDAIISTIHATGNKLLAGTTGTGFVMIDTSDDINSTMVLSNASFFSPTTSPSIVSYSVTSIEILDDQILVSGEGGVDRFHIPSDAWLSPWTTSNWLDSNDVLKVITLENYAYVVTLSKIHRYDSTVLAFTGAITSNQANLTEFDRVFSWPTANQGIAASDGAGSLAKIVDMIAIEPLVLASGPAILEPQVVSVVNAPSGKQAWVASGSEIDRFDEESKRWLGVIDYSKDGIDSEITDVIQIDAQMVIASTSGHGIIQIDPTDGALIGTVSGSDVAAIDTLGYDASTGKVFVLMPEYGIAIGNTSDLADYSFFDEDSGLDSLEFTSMAYRSDILYIGTTDAGVMRIEVSSEVVLSSWRSLGIDDVDEAPIEYVDGDDRILVGLKGFGIIILDRFTGEVLHVWDEADGTLPDNDINDIYSDINGNIIISSEGPSFWNPGIAAMWDGADYFQPTWTSFPTSIPGPNNDPYQFFEATSNVDGIYMGTNRGACMWDWSLNGPDCWSSADGLPSRFVNTVAILEPNRLYAGTSEGVGIIDTSTGTVVDVWTAAADSDQTDVVVIDSVVYLGVEGIGIARYDLNTQEWLATWDGNSGLIDNDLITLLKVGEAPGTIWAGGYFGLVNINTTNEQLNLDWNLGPNSGGPTLPYEPPLDVIVHDGILYYQQIVPSQSWQARDSIARVDMQNNTSLAQIDTTDTLGYQGQIRGMHMVHDNLWLGVAGVQGWGGAEPGDIARWNTTSGNWEDPIGSYGSVQRVNAQFVGDCFPTASENCEFWVSYGDSILRRYNATDMTLLDSWDDIPGPIRGIESFGDTYLFGSMDGILRWDSNNSSFLTPWTPGSGMPSNVADRVYSMRVVGDDLWVGTYQGGNIDVSIYNQSQDSWDVTPYTDVGGYAYPADIEICEGIVHVAFGRLQWWQGGYVARYDYLDSDGNGIAGEWIDAWEDGNGLDDADPRAIACDESHPMLYVAYDSDNVGISRFDYSTDTLLSAITPSDGISPEPVFPGGILYDNGILLVSHVDEGGISRIETSGLVISTGTVFGVGMDGSSIVRAPPASDFAYAIGRSGETSGVNRVDRLDPTGLIEGGFDELLILPSGDVVEFVSNGSRVWAAIGTSNQGNWQSSSGYGRTIMEGTVDQNGTLTWLDSYDFNDDIVEDVILDGNTLWISTTYRGMIALDTNTKQTRTHPGSIHNSMDGMYLENGKLYVGLTSVFDAASGFQVLDTTSRIWNEAELLAALPANDIGDFLRLGNVTLVTTPVGIGRFDESAQEWLDPITTYDGLPPDSDRIEVASSNRTSNLVVISSPSGLSFIQNPTQNASVGTRVTQSDGLMSSFIADIHILPERSKNITLPDGTTQELHQPKVLIASHPGVGASRPWVSSWAIDDQEIFTDYPLDMLPSNGVTALATDGWGVHIATDIGPMYHYNFSSYSMEIGLVPGSLQAWPITIMESDGTRVVAAGSGFNVIGSQDHQSRGYDSAMESSINDMALYGDTLVLATDRGTLAYRPYWALERIYVDEYARAENLDLTFLGQTTDITEEARPGNKISIPSNVPITDSPLPLQSQNFGSIPFSWHPTIFTSSTSSQPIWSEVSILNYTGTWNLSTQTGLQQLLQMAVDTAGAPSSANWEFALSPPESGSINMRITYDWTRQEIPTRISYFDDRPRDGGDGLILNWDMAVDPSFISYDIFVWGSTTGWSADFVETGDFSQITPIASISDVQTLGVSIEEAYSGDTIQTIQSGEEYFAAIAIRYPDGSLGPMSVYNGSAMAIDNVPEPPSSMYAEPIGFSGGSLQVEWQPCTDIDRHSTRLWYSTVEIDDVEVIPTYFDVAQSLGNQTIIDVPQSTPIWLAASCVDMAGQYERDNPALYGPVIAAGGLDDSIPPARVSGVEASDLPFDDGGYLQVTWTPNSEEDCVMYTIHVLPASGFSPPTSAEGWPVAEIVSGCENSVAIIGGTDGTLLENGVRYWVAVVAYDDWGNGDLNNVLPDDATPFDNLAEGGPEPARLQDVSAFDHPFDDGTSIDVVWTRSDAPDFSYYTIWVSEHPLEDVSSMWFFCSEEPQSCGLTTIQQRQIGGSSKIEIEISEALYGTTLTDSVSSRIIPEVPLHVAVTVHDIAGNVHLDNLETALALPQSNLEDTTPPDRIPAPGLADRDPDHGDGMFVLFDPSESADLSSYEIYVVPDSPFLLTNLEALEPSLTLPRDWSGPALVELSTGIEGKTDLAPDRRYFVTVVARDSNGNAWTTDLQSSDIVLTDELGLDPCPACPDVSGLTAAWNPSGSRIVLNWAESDNPEVIGYHVFASLIPFNDVRDASIVALDRTTTEFGFDLIDEQALDRDTNHYVEVVAYDGEKFTYRASPVLVLPWTEQAGPLDSQASEGSSVVDRLVSGDLNILLGTIIFGLAALGAAATFRSRRGMDDDLWEISTREVEIDALFDDEIQSGLNADETKEIPVKKLSDTKIIPDSTDQPSSDDYLDDLEKDLDDLF